MKNKKNRFVSELFLQVSLSWISNFWTFINDNIYTKHEDKTTKENKTWKYKGLNLHYRHLLILKVGQDIKIWRCTYSSMQIKEKW